MSSTRIGGYSKGSVAVDMFYSAKDCGTTITEDAKAKQVTVVFGGVRLTALSLSSFLVEHFIPAMLEMASVLDEKPLYARPETYTAFDSLGKMVERIQDDVIATVRGT